MLRVNRRISVLLLAALILSACLPLVAPEWLSPSLQLIGHLSGTALAVAVQGNYAYLGFSYELVVLDIADRSNPQWITSLPIPANDIALAGDYAYVVGRDGFTVVDISDPTQPQVRGHLTSPVTVAAYITPDCARQVVSANGQLYVTDRFGGLYIFVLITAP